MEGQRDDHRKALKSVGAERDRLREAARIVTENRWYERLTEAEAWRERAETAERRPARVREVHARDNSNLHGPWCGACMTTWPCPTTGAALDYQEAERG